MRTSPPTERRLGSRSRALPPSIARKLEGYRWWRNLVGAGDADVYRLQRDGVSDLYLKHGRGQAAEAIVDEFTRVRWLTGQMPVAEIEHFESTGNRAWLLTRAIPGRTAHAWLVDASTRAPQIVSALARFLARLHALPVDACPFNAHHTLRLVHARQRLDAGLIDPDDFDAARRGWTPQQVWQELCRLTPVVTDAVVTHGDCSLDNILLDADGNVTGMIDLGRLGLADRYQDLAVLWNDLEAFGEHAQDMLFSAYGIEQPDIRKVHFHLCLDECF